MEIFNHFMYAVKDAAAVILISVTLAKIKEKGDDNRRLRLVLLVILFLI